MSGGSRRLGDKEMQLVVETKHELLLVDDDVELVVVEWSL